MPKELEKEEAANAKVNRKKKIIEIREEINELENRKTIKKISQEKVVSLKRHAKFTNP